MDIYKLNNFRAQDGDNFIIGSFESFHIGHYQLFKNIRNNPGRKIIVTFNNELGMPKFNGQIFMDNYAKYTLLASQGFDAAIELNFNEISQLDGKDFLRKIIQNAHNLTISVGKDFRFGKNAHYQASDIQKFTNAEVFLNDLYKFKNVKISTSHLKNLLEYGQIDLLNILLVDNYSFGARIQDKTLLQVHEKLASMHSGIYSTLVHDGILSYFAILHINFENQRQILLIDAKNNFSNKQVLIEVLHTIRLITQKAQEQILEQDILQAKNYFVDKFMKK